MSTLPPQRSNAQKVHWSEARQQVVLEVTPCSIDQLDAATGAPLASYMYKDIESLVPVSDIPGGLCIQVGSFDYFEFFTC